jgi:hypothetical protein
MAVCTETTIKAMIRNSPTGMAKCTETTIKTMLRNSPPCTEPEWQ